ncbi:MAG TPA: Crp/Fnr family transcriptional regulator [Myxococcales bacterium]|nr:Crp/Fnr family transcriptional regulator [Myxococcales bacterium]
MATGELQEFLARTSFFGGLMPEVVGAVADMLKERRVAAGEVLFEEGDQGRSMFIVREGALIVQRHCSDGTQARLLMMRPGDFFGVTALIDMEPRPFSCRAEKDCLLYELTNLDLYRLYKSDVKTYVLVLQNINRELVRRLRKAGSRIATLEDALHAAPGHRDGH